ncbi:MAG TPA: hypothetical protein VG892_08685 [Terriglobales bacterium]|nr:hypothetical protein [Terriglobales bacterium]
MHPAHLQRRRSSLRQKRSGEAGYILLLLTFFVSLLAIAALAAAPQVIQQGRRDREEEMIHRGAQYARAIRKFVKKTGAYPTSMEQLETTNNVRYLRRRYKDPMSPDGEWRALRAGDVPFLQAAQANRGPGQPAGQSFGQPPAGTGSTGLTSGSGGILGGQQGSTGLSVLQAMQGGGTGGLTGSGGLSGSGGLGGIGGSSSTTGSSSTSSTSTTSTGSSSTSSTGSTTSRGPVFGGGAIVGVASISDREGLREFNKKKKYNEWFFVYDPISELANPNGAGLITGPYTGKSFAQQSKVGIPAGQLASPNQPAGFGQPIGTGFGGTSPSNSSPNSFGTSSRP